jgi:hypothetical protein
MFANLLALFRKPTPLEVATRELIEAEHAKLQAQTATEYALAISQYNMTRIERLLKYINESTSVEPK